MILSLALHTVLLAKPTLNDLNTKVRQFPGVIVESEMTSPSVVPMTFKVSPSGLMVAKYPTTEQFYSKDEVVTWMPDRREYSRAKPEDLNPLPVGFHALWAGGETEYKQVGETKDASFAGKSCYEMDLAAKGGYTIHLFVEQANLMPKGTRVELNGTTYESVYKSVTVGKLDEKTLRFQPPKDSRPAGKFDPSSTLIKPGTKLTDFAAKDGMGKKWKLSSLLSSHRGVVLNFWFSACTGCVAEMPYLVGLAPKLAKSKIAMLGVNTIDEKSAMLRTATKNKLPYPTLIGTGAESLTKAVSVQAYPVTVVVDKKGTVVDAILGFDEARLTKAIKVVEAPN
ncbi:MAG: TlpA family protein disulfide reductase [Armatimonadetes bacterium]|nr:TlpA family protein disulfide reductase [Armatimonadota bacterium]